MLLVQINLPVNLWNALKFIFMQIIISVFFANAWTAFVRRRSARLLFEGHKVTLLSTNLGRLTPASLVYKCNGTGVSFSPITVRLFVFVVNILLLASALLTEYGSSSARRVETETLHVANRRTIENFQQKTNSAILNTLKVPTFLIQEDVQQSALKALKRSSNSSAGIPTYVLHEHVYGAEDGSELEHNSKNDLELHEVCGIDPIQPLSPCARLIERTLALPSENSAMLFTVTRLYDLNIPEAPSGVLEDTFVGVQLVTVWPGATQWPSTKPTRNRVDVRLRNVTGVCAGQSKGLTSDLRSEFIGFLQHCVLSDEAGRRILIAEGRDHYVPDEVKALLTSSSRGSDWSKPGSVALLTAAAQKTITFHARVPPLLSLVSLMRVVDVRDSLFVFNELPFGVDVRRTVLLRALALVGSYTSKLQVSVRLPRTVATVNTLFFVGLAALFFLIAALTVAAVYAGQMNFGKDQPPTDVRDALYMLKRLHCCCAEENCSICIAPKLPIFVEDASLVKIECCRMDDTESGFVKYPPYCPGTCERCYFVSS